MFKYSLSGNYVFHGSPVKLEPGVDLLKPHCAACERKARLYLGDFSAALRFALVRGFGCDQMCGSDFYVFATRKYKIIIYSAGALGKNWMNMPVDKFAYLYAVSRKDLDVDLGRDSFCAYKKMPIAARAMVNLDSLKDADFSFAVDSASTMRWWGVNNSDTVIERAVIPNLKIKQR